MNRKRIGIITSKNAEPLIRQVLLRDKDRINKLDVDIDIITLPVPSIGHLKTETIAYLLRNRIDPSRYAALLVPGSCPGSTRVIEETIGVETFKASIAPGLLVDAIRELVEGDGLSKEEAYESPRGSPEGNDLLEAFRINGVSIPVRGPPFVIASEIPPEIPLESIRNEARRLVNEGADLIVVGLSREYQSVEYGLKRIELAFNSINNGRSLLLCEASSLKIVRLGEQYCDGYSMSAAEALAVAKAEPGLLEDKLVIVGERDITTLKETVRLMTNLDIKYIAVDPVVGLPLLDFSDTVRRYNYARELEVPLVFSAANFTEEIAADTHGVHATLSVLAAELGASIYYVVESSYHGLHGTREAFHASRLVARAVRLGRTPRLPGSRLLVIRDFSPPIGGRFDRDFYKFVGRIEPVLEKNYFIINIDYNSRLILVDYYTRGRREKGWAGTNALSLIRAIVRETSISPEHAGYLGYELHKAELALRLGKQYRQDYPLIIPPWEEG